MYKTTFERYSFFKISCLDPNIKDCYIGTTTDFEYAKQCYVLWNTPNHQHYNSKLCRAIRTHGNWENWEMTEIDNLYTDDYDDVKRIIKELIHILNPTLNMI